MSVMFLKHWATTSVVPDQVLYWVGGGSGEECGKEEHQTQLHCLDPFSRMRFANGRLRLRFADFLL
jgi:hypothetical protein